MPDRLLPAGRAVLQEQMAFRAEADRPPETLAYKRRAVPGAEKAVKAARLAVTAARHLLTPAAAAAAAVMAVKAARAVPGV